MGGKKTRDGLGIERVARNAIRKFSELGIELREATRHPYTISYQGMIPCALASSTDVRRQVAPFIARASNGAYSTNEVYEMLRR